MPFRGIPRNTKKDFRFVTALLAAGFLIVAACSHSRAGFLARIELLDRAGEDCPQGGRLPLRLRLTNQGSLAWESSGPRPILLSYHLLDGDRRMLRFDNARTPLPERVQSGGSVEIELHLRAPLTPGRYHAEFDLLQEGVTWFREKESPTLIFAFEVFPRAWPDANLPPGLKFSPSTRIRSGIPELEGLFRLIRLTLEENAVSMQGRTGSVQAFAPGSDYPQIWLRDSATIIPAARWFYQLDRLAPWLEEHLAFQEESGALQDWFDSRGQTGKNTTESDQEASAVSAARKIVSLTGSGWLEKNIAGKSVIERLENALEFVFRERFDRDSGLVIGAHTADWGDVDWRDKGPEAVKTDDRTLWTGDIYDQAMIHRACRSLAEMLELLERPAGLWRERAKNLRRAAVSRLWQPGRGFFRIHIHLDGSGHEFPEEDIFAMGGNAVAVLAGIAGDDQARSIFRTALERQKEFGISTLSGTLLPPYPKGAFRHPLLDEPFEYQNGGQWDWFGGRLIAAMFRKGYSREAKTALVEIARKNLDNLGFFEWDTPEGSGRGSDLFCGGAGSMALALMEGYFGLRPDRVEGFRLEPRIGGDSAAIQAYQPADGSFTAFEHRFDASADRLIFEYHVSGTNAGTIGLLFPWTSGEAGTPEFQITLELDGRAVPFDLVSEGEDLIVRFAAPGGRHTCRLLRKSGKKP